MDALIKEIHNLSHSSICISRRKTDPTSKCTCGLDNLLCRSVLVKADTLMEISKCRTKGLQAIEKLLASFAARDE